MKKRLLFVLLFCFLLSGVASAQFYIGPNFGFKAFGLKGATTIAQGGQITQLGNFDAGKTVMTVGICTGVQVLPRDVAGGWYKLDLNLDVNYSSIGFAEKGYEYVNGTGSWSANGFSGGTTTNLAFDVMPIHRLNIPKFQLLSPFVGLGFGVNLFMTSDVSQTIQNNPQAFSIKGNSEMKMGLLVFYGTVLRASDLIQPYIQFKHYIPFGSETQLTSDAQNGNLIMKDVPGYFNISGGVRFNFE